MNVEIFFNNVNYFVTYCCFGTENVYSSTINCWCTWIGELTVNFILSNHLIGRYPCNKDKYCRNLNYDDYDLKVSLQIDTLRKKYIYLSNFSKMLICLKISEEITLHLFVLLHYFFIIHMGK